MSYHFLIVKLKTKTQTITDSNCWLATSSWSAELLTAALIRVRLLGSSEMPISVTHYCRVLVPTAGASLLPPGCSPEVPSCWEQLTSPGRGASFCRWCDMIWKELGSPSKFSRSSCMKSQVWGALLSEGNNNLLPCHFRGQIAQWFFILICPHRIWEILFIVNWFLDIITVDCLL